MRVKFDELDTFDSTEKMIVNFKHQRNVELDILMVDLIQKLNDRGFKTEYCCSGHESDAFMNFYIKFGKLNKNKTKDLINIIDRISALFYEVDYKIRTENVDNQALISYSTDNGEYVNFPSSFILLIDPTDEDIKNARRIVNKNGMIPDSLIYETSHIIVRPKIRKEIFDDIYKDTRVNHLLVSRNLMLIYYTILTFENLL